MNIQIIIYILNVDPIHTINAQKVRRGIVPLILSLDTE
jgi:hypothetical protein